jgi:histidyl-tRNA synthetase
MPRRKKETRLLEEVKTIKTPPIVKGMKDTLPGDGRYWDYIEEQVKRVVRDYSFRRMYTPSLEKYELFNHTLFKHGGLFEKESFSFLDKGEKLVLRPDYAPSIARAFIEHNMENQPMPIKVYYSGPVFRQGKIEENRLRQFTQLGFEIIGDKSPAIDAELIIVAHYLLKNLYIENEVRLNSLGCAGCRPEYSKALAGFLKAKRTAICPDCRKRGVKEPLKFLSCKNAKCVRVREDAPQIIDWLCDDCRNHLFKVLEYLDELKIPYRLDSALLRTYDYYNKTVFEINPLNKDKEKKEGETDDVLSLAAGGRHDNLIEMLGGKNMPAAGFYLGMERIVNQMKLNRNEIPSLAEPDVFVTQIGEQARQKAFSFFEKLRGEGLSVRANFSKSSLKAQLDMAIKSGAKLILILGQKEVMEGTVLLRDVASGIQEVVNINKVLVEVNRKLKEK